LEILRGRGVLKAKIFKGKYEPKMEFPVGGSNEKTLHGGVWIFSETTHYILDWLNLPFL